MAKKVQNGPELPYFTMSSWPIYILSVNELCSYFEMNLCRWRSIFQDSFRILLSSRDFVPQIWSSNRRILHNSVTSRFGVPSRHVSFPKNKKDGFVLPISITVA